MKKALFCLMMILPSIMLAQVTEEWVARYNGSQSYDDRARDIAVDNTGNVYVTGSCYNPWTNWDYATFKYDSSGHQQWEALYDGPGHHRDNAVAIAVDNTGNVYVTGKSFGSVSGFDYATVKYSSSGHQQWVARYDGPASFTDEVRDIAVDGSGNVYVTGYSKGSGTYYDYATVKYNTSGIEQWVARDYGPGIDDKAAAIAVDDAGNVYVTGISTGPETGDDYMTIKYNSSDPRAGWVARYNGPGGFEDRARDIAVDNTGNVYVTGYSYTSTTHYDYLTVKYDSSGHQQWVARYDGSASGEDEAVAIALDDAGNVYVTGSSEGSWTSSDYATVKYNSSGDVLWVARYDGPANYQDRAVAIAVDNTDNVYVTGSIYGSGTTHYNYTTVKYNSSGVQQWVAMYNGPGSGEDEARALALDDAGNVYVTGSSEGSGTDDDYATIKYSQQTGIAEASVDAPEYQLEVTQLASEPVITYTLPVDTRISLKLYDVTGQLVRTLVSGSQKAGTHTIYWPVTHPKTPSGVYFVRLETSNRSATAKLVVAR